MTGNTALEDLTAIRGRGHTRCTVHLQAHVTHRRPLDVSGMRPMRTARAPNRPGSLTRKLALCLDRLARLNKYRDPLQRRIGQ
jgi:hypothetical protein